MMGFRDAVASAIPCAQICTSRQTDNHTNTYQSVTGRMLFLTPKQHLIRPQKYVYLALTILCTQSVSQAQFHHTINYTIITLTFCQPQHLPLATARRTQSLVLLSFHICPEQIPSLYLSSVASDHLHTSLSFLLPLPYLRPWICTPHMSFPPSASIHGQ